jgi:hypothetical protein
MQDGSVNADTIEVRWLVGGELANPNEVATKAKSGLDPFYHS